MSQQNVITAIERMDQSMRIDAVNFITVGSFFRLFPLIIVTALILSGCDSTMTKPNQSKLAEITPQSDACSVALAEHVGNEEVDQKIRRYQKRAKQPERKVAYLERLGWSYIAKARLSFDPGYYKLAEQSADCMASYQADNLSARLLKGHVLHNLHRFKEAEVIASGLVEQRGRWFDYGLYGDVLMEQGRLDDAIDAYQAMMNEYPGPQAYTRAAYIRWLKDDTEGAIELMVKSLKSMGTRNREATAWVLVRLARFEFQLNHTERSLRYLDVALQRLGNFAPALLEKGRIYLAAGENLGAVDALREAAKLNPLPEYRWALIEGLRLVGKSQEAEEFEKLLFENGAVEDRRTLALYLASTGQQSMRAVKLGLEEIENRADIFTLDTVAWALRSSGDLEGAYQYSQEAISEGTPDARLYYHAAVLALETARYSEASSKFRQAALLQHQLLPSERDHLLTKFAAVKPPFQPSVFTKKSTPDLS